MLTGWKYNRVSQRAVLFADAIDDGIRRRALLKRAAMIGVGEGQRFHSGKRGRQRKFTQVRIVVHFDVKGIF